MRSRRQIKNRIREVEKDIRFEEGRLSVHMEQQREEGVDTCKAIQATIRQMNAVVATLKEVLI